jgi:hypothetical protein
VDIGSVGTQLSHAKIATERNSRRVPAASFASRAEARAVEFLRFLLNAREMVVEIKIERGLISFGEDESQELPRLFKVIPCASRSDISCLIGKVICIDCLAPRLIACSKSAAASGSHASQASVFAALRSPSS